ncbi:MAG: 4-hydroxy-tetrahydrodipicolinate synthase [Candidatus Omnitrophica bacterium ADurb.Bin292]|jgi:4-hydroxy-tetrahydrodipicolinate synthase|nr:MAG: 4-hydroxy-tetrahydrodipicolinate synthase [Candidatus Omnitrophica bacterium ADurb.Bin292]HPW76671.1 4-hydroxy-tetrahydrodipicolinate synthase [Candidatus Omnitrophota bacterium]HQB11653.1 4-hydroxy-tetrahydrodipicolinate synthase [Candidatus Omnitrophota bacterium]
MSKKNPDLRGSMVALVTPFRNGKVDRKAMKGLIDFQIKSGTDVLVPCGTTGESATLSHEEHRDTLSFVVDYVDGRVPVIAGCGSNNTAEALGLVRHARKIGASAALIVTPYYNRPTQEGLYRHYEFLASRVDIPIVLYNVPGRTGVSIAPETVARLSKIDTIVAIKEASGSMDQADKIMQLCDIAVISGEDSLTYPLIAIGAQGVISVTANVVPGLVHDMVWAALDGKMTQAAELHRRHYPFSKVAFIETNPIPVKTALGWMGKLKPELRLPLCEMRPENEKKLLEVLKQLGIPGK